MPSRSFVHPAAQLLLGAALAFSAAGATANGLLYCFGGANSGNPFQSGVTFYDDVQVYTP